MGYKGLLIKEVDMFQKVWSKNQNSGISLIRIISFLKKKQLGTIQVKHVRLSSVTVPTGQAKLTAVVEL